MYFLAYYFFFKIFFVLQYQELNSGKNLYLLITYVNHHTQSCNSLSVTCYKKYKWVFY